jgi:hypothetical protein
VGTEAVATELTFVEKRSHTNYVSAGVGGLRNQTSGVIAVSGVSGTVTKAYLYWQGPTRSLSPTVNASIKLNGNTVVGTNIGFSNDNCWFYDNSQGYRADVTSIVTGNGSYTISDYRIDPPSTVGGANLNGASLIVFFNGGSLSSKRDVYLFNGNDSNVPNVYDGNGWSATFSGINYSFGAANLQLHVSDGQNFNEFPEGPTEDISLNEQPQGTTGHVFDGNTVPSTNNGPGNNGNLWDIRNFAITSFLSPGLNTIQLTAASSPADCLSLVVAVVDVANNNQAPVASADQYVVNVGQTLTVPAPGVLANDVDPDGDALTASLFNSPLHAATGGFTLNADGSFTYTPATGFTGTDSFSYVANDGSFFGEGPPPPASSIGNVTIKVNDPAAQTAIVQNFSSTCEVTLNLTFNPATADTFVVRPTDFHKHWHCHVIDLTTGFEVPPKSVHGPPGITLQVDGDPAHGDLQKVLSGQSATFQARGSLCDAFDLPNGNFKALCTAENSITDPTVNPDTGTCLDVNECLGAPIRTYIAPAQEFTFASSGGSINPGDQCPTLDGGAGEGAAGTGCPFAYQILVTLNKHALANVNVRIFSRSNPGFLQVTGGDRNPPPTLYPKIYEANQGVVGACRTDTSGHCTAGIPLKEAMLILVKFTNPTTGKADYDGSPGSSSDFPTGSVVGTKQLNIKR